MGTGTEEKVKGSVKEAAGALSGNEKLKKEGRADQKAGKAKEKAAEAMKEKAQAKS